MTVWLMVHFRSTEIQEVVRIKEKSKHLELYYGNEVYNRFDLDEKNKEIT